MEKMLKKLFWTAFSWAPIPFKRYQNTSGCGKLFRSRYSRIDQIKFAEDCL